MKLIKKWDVYNPQGKSLGTLLVHEDESNNSIVFTEEEDDCLPPQHFYNNKKLLYAYSEIRYKTSDSDGEELVKIAIQLDDIAAFHRTNVLFKEAIGMGLLQSNLAETIVVATKSLQEFRDAKIIIGLIPLLEDFIEKANSKRQFLFKAWTWFPVALACGIVAGIAAKMAELIWDKF